MLDTYIDEDKKTLEVHLTRLQSLLAAKRSFSIPINHVSLPIIIRPEEAKKFFKGWSYSKMDFPGKFTAGVFWSWDLHTKTFYYIDNPDNCIKINLTGNEELNAIILGMEEGKTPEEAAAEISKATEHLLQYSN